MRPAGCADVIHLESPEKRMLRRSNLSFCSSEKGEGGEGGDRTPRQLLLSHRKMSPSGAHQIYVHSWHGLNVSARVRCVALDKRDHPILAPPQCIRVGNAASDGCGGAAADFILDGTVLLLFGVRLWPKGKQSDAAVSGGDGPPQAAHALFDGQVVFAAHATSGQQCIQASEAATAGGIIAA